MKFGGGETKIFNCQAAGASKREAVPCFGTPRKQLPLLGCRSFFSFLQCCSVKLSSRGPFETLIMSAQLWPIAGWFTISKGFLKGERSGKSGRSGRTRTVTFWYRLIHPCLSVCLLKLMTFLLLVVVMFFEGNLNDMKQAYEQQGFTGLEACAVQKTLPAETMLHNADVSVSFKNDEVNFFCCEHFRSCAFSVMGMIYLAYKVDASDNCPCYSFKRLKVCFWDKLHNFSALFKPLKHSYTNSFIINLQGLFDCENQSDNITEQIK